MVGVYSIHIINNYVFKRLLLNNEVAIKLSKKLKSRRECELFKLLIENIYKNNIIGKHVVSGQLTNQVANYKSPYITGINIGYMKNILKQASVIKVKIIYSIYELIKSLNDYYNKYHILIGDWGLHNLIWDVSTERLINIDLEGFYTYSPIGLNLSWDIQENNIRTVSNKLKSVAKTVLLNIYNNINNIEYTKEITTVLLPTGYQLCFPFNIPNIPNIHPKFKSIILDTNYTGVGFHYYVYLRFIKKKPYVLINSNLSDNLGKYVFRFTCKIKANTFKIINKERPLRNIFVG